MTEADKVVMVAEILHERFNNLTLKETNQLALKIVKALTTKELEDDEIPF